MYVIIEHTGVLSSFLLQKKAIVLPDLESKVGGFVSSLNFCLQHHVSLSLLLPK